MKILTPVAIAAALLCAACDIRVDDNGIRGIRISEGRAEDVWTRTYTLPAGGILEIVGQNGEIDVRAADGPQVEVRADREVRANNDEVARDLLSKLQIREEVAPGSVKLATQGEESAWAPPGLGRRAQARIEYHVRVPAGLTLTFRTENGGVRLENVNGRITASTTNGGITGTDLGGSVDAQSVNGGIRMDLASVSGDVSLTTTNGGVRLDLPGDVKASLEASCVNGGIAIDDRFGVDTGDRSNRRVSASLNGGGPRISATSVNGGIRIRARGSRQTD
jgi:putative adhesin